MGFTWHQEEYPLGEVVTVDEYAKPLSYTHSDVWDFSFDRAKGGRIEFTNRRCGKYKKQLQLTLKKLMDNRPMLLYRRLDNILSKLVRLAQYIGSTQWNSLDDDRFCRQWLLELSDRNISKATLKHYFILETAVGSLKYAQALNAPRKFKKLSSPIR